VDQARKLKELEQENAKLKRLVSELSLEKLVEGHRLGKLLSLDRRRCAVDPGCELHGMSERGARRVVKQLRGTQRYRPTQRDDEDTFTQAIVTLASQYGRYGYRRITALLRRAGWQVDRRCRSCLKAGGFTTTPSDHTHRSAIAPRYPKPGHFKPLSTPHPAAL
jgi:hypothetical protein